MASRKIDSYDVSPKMRAVIEWRHERRQQLRQEYLKECLNPTKQKLLVDSAIDRFATMRLLHEMRQKVDAKGAVLWHCLVVGSIVTLALTLKQAKSKQESKYRSGQVKYADRDNKFA